jgi:MYXO-CTERM domain-containing protein
VGACTDVHRAKPWYSPSVEGDTRRLTGRSLGSIGIAAIALTAFGGVVVVVTEVDAGWQRPHADAQASNRVLEPAQLVSHVSGSDQHPGFSEIVEIERPELTETTLRDVTGDGVPELLLPWRGRVAAIDMTHGGFVWQSGVAGVDSIVDFADFDGNGEVELLAASSRVGGGLLTLDPSSGAILAKSAPLPNRSGIDGNELAIADIDQDGDDDVVYPAAFYGLMQVWFDGLGSNADQWAASLGFAGYANITPMRVGRFMPGGVPAVMLDQGSTQQLFERCSDTSPGAACGESSCWCPATPFTGVHPEAYAFGQAFVVDVDGDDVDEILTVADDSRYTRSLSVFSPAQARAAGEGAAGQLWYRDYSEDATLPVTPRVAPIDLDQDGSIELLVNFVDNLDGDRNLAGQPIDDGIDHVGLSVAVFDARTGEVEVTLENAFAHGWLDLDNDGRLELVVSPVLGYKWQAGLRGYELGCGNGCLEQAWSVPHAFAPGLVRESFDRHHVPHHDSGPTLLAMRVDDRDALLAYDGGALHLLRMSDAPPDMGAGQVQSTATRLLAPEQSVHEVDASGFAVLSDGKSLQLIDAKLASAGPSIPIPVQGTKPWTTARLDGFDAPMFEDKLYDAPLPASASFAAPEPLLPHVALSENLDGEGNDEIIDFRRPQDELGPGFEVRALGWEQGALDVRWSVVSEDHPALAQLELSGAMHFATGNFNGQGARDLVFMTFDPARVAYVVAVDGDSGAVLRVQAATTPSATYTPLLVGDFAGLDGSPQPDGIDDVLIDGPRALELIVLGVGPIWTQPTSFYHAVGAQADLDGDGVNELIATTSNTLENPGEALDFLAMLDGITLQAQWGPSQLGLPTGRTQALAFAHVDGDAGLDLLYITGEGALELRNGQTGAMMAGAPVFLSDGQRSPVADPEAASLGALMIIDVDNDGHDEAIVGADDGWVYALDIASDDVNGANGSPGSILWALEVGAPVSQIAAGDVDEDGFQELLVATEAGQGIVLDSLGVGLDITGPDDSCFEVGTVEVTGTARGLAFVDVHLNGDLVDTVAVEGPSWAAQVVLSGPGEYELRAEGRDEVGELVALSTSAITYGDDQDGDGVTACGGDCNDQDPGASPDHGEVCGDGIDQDCDGVDAVCDDLPGDDGVSSGGDCNCSSEPDRRGLGGVMPLGMLGMVIVLARRRRQSAH